ncbi:hypothetical protein [Acinetobacter ihumii]|uniref:hypothetical protein n=1 Tax=Acinetobacter ihumii TaxID=2483802 RepID=UPI001031C7D9|nr:hypothetical protein [Acinetobacter ihumii]
MALPFSTAQKGELDFYSQTQEDHMLILKNICIFIFSITLLCLFVIILNKFGIRPLINLSFSALIYGLFAAYYFKTAKLFIVYLTIFYGCLLLISLDLKVIFMFIISIISYSLMKISMPELKRAPLESIMIKQRSYKN